MATKSLKRFEVLENIGDGAYGIIIKCKHNISEIIYAIKRIQLKTKNAEKTIKEVKLLSRLVHPNIVRYCDSWIGTLIDNEEDVYGKESSEEYSYSYESESSNKNVITMEKQYLYIQMEFCEKKTLRDAINEDLYKNKERIFRLSREILEGLEYIHQCALIHRDLKPENIFLDQHDHVKIGDFGLATILPKSSPTIEASHGKNALQQKLPAISLTGWVGTPLYTAPEIDINAIRSYYNNKIDIFSLGVILFEMFYPPCKTSQERVKILQQLAETNIIMPKDFINPDNHNVIYLMRSMLNHDEKLRPTCTELLQKLEFCKKEYEKVTRFNDEDFIYIFKIKDAIEKILRSHGKQVVSEFTHLINRNGDIIKLSSNHLKYFAKCMILKDITVLTDYSKDGNNSDDFTKEIPNPDHGVELSQTEILSVVYQIYKEMRYSTRASFILLNHTYDILGCELKEYNKLPEQSHSTRLKCKDGICFQIECDIYIEKEYNAFYQRYLKTLDNTENIYVNRLEQNLLSNSELNQHVIGAVVVGVVFNKGIILGTDIISTKGYKLKNNDEDLFIKNTISCGSGNGADVLKMATKAKSRVDNMPLEHNQECSTINVANILSTVLRQYQGICANYIMGGFDSNRFHLYYVGSDGHIIEKPCISAGVGRHAAMSVLKARWHIFLNKDDAKTLVLDAISSGMNSVSLCNNVKIWIMQEQGCGISITNENVEHVRKKKSLRYQCPKGTTEVLSTKIHK